MGVPLVRLDEVAEVRLGRQRSPKNHLGTQMRPYVRAANVGWGGLILDDVKTMNFTDGEMKVYRLKRGDLLLGEASGSPKEVGKPAIWNGEIEDCAFQNTLLRVRPRTADPRYLLHFFMHEARSGNFASQSRGVGIHHLGRKALASWRVPLPPLVEQQRIVRILDQTDRLRSQRHSAVATVDVLAESIFIDFFGDPVTNPRKWPENTTLESVADIVSGITKGRKLIGATTREVPYLAVVNVQDRRLDLSSVKTIQATEAEISRYQLKCGDLLLTEGGDPDKLGRGSLWNEEVSECIHQNHIFRVRITDNLITPLFLNWLIGSKRGKRYFLKSAKQTTGIASINLRQLRAFPILIPPMDLQLRFASAIEELSGLTAEMQQSRSALDHLFASLQYRAFQDEI
jgi:type I restriction enzyme S subunit